MTSLWITLTYTLAIFIITALQHIKYFFFNEFRVHINIFLILAIKFVAVAYAIHAGVFLPTKFY